MEKYRGDEVDLEKKYYDADEVDNILDKRSQTIVNQTKIIAEQGINIRERDELIVLQLDEISTQSEEIILLRIQLENEQRKTYGFIHSMIKILKNIFGNGRNK